MQGDSPSDATLISHVVCGKKKHATMEGDKRHDVALLALYYVHPLWWVYQQYV